MLKQFKYAARTNMSTRLSVLIPVVALNILMFIFNGINSNGLMITTTVFSGLLLCAWMVVCIIADVTQMKELFAVKTGYAFNLIPVSSTKIILGRTLAMVVWDVVGFLIAAAGVMINALIFGNRYYNINNEIVQAFADASLSAGDVMKVILTAVAGIVTYALFLLLIMLIVALRKSIFYSLKGGTVYAVVAGAAVTYIFQVFDLLLLPFAEYTRSLIYFNIYISLDNYLAIAIYLILRLVKAALLVGSVSYLMERKMNI